MFVPFSSAQKENAICHGGTSMAKVSAERWVGHVPAADWFRLECLFLQNKELAIQEEGRQGQS